MRNIDQEMNKALKKFGFDKFFKANNVAFIGVLADINRKFDSCTNLGISCFGRK